jgi:hypothetical protein
MGHGQVIVRALGDELIVVAQERAADFAKAGGSTDD